MELSLSAWRDGRELSFGAIIRDATDRRENEARLFRLAHLDPLTELPNRAALWTKLDDMLAVGQPVAVLLLDLDDFKEVNDLAGHLWGDRVLRCVARRIREAMGDSQVAARLGGDEFVVLMENVGDPLVAAGLADELIAAMRPTFDIDGQPVHLGVSIGIAIAPAHGVTAEELLANVDLALYRAKAEGRQRHHLFVPTMRQAANARRTCETELRNALAKGEFELFYQPQVRLRDSSLVGAEALLRWRHPERGLLAPAAFIGVLESLPLAAEVGDWVVRTACAQAAEWRAAGIDDFKVSVNLFGAQFRSGNLVETIERALVETSLPAEALELEITENIILRHEKQMTEQLRVLCRRGVSVAFDDYGTGFASLSQLKLFPLTKLKIDQSFVREMCCDSQDAAVVKAILHLGRSFGVKVIAEGIELLQQHDVLLENGCDEGQGFLYGRAMAARDFEPRLMEWRQVA